MPYSEAEQGTHVEDEDVDEPQKEQGVSVVKRRHARPQELDSDEEDEEEEEEENSGNVEKLGSKQEESKKTNIVLHSDQV